MKRDVAIVLIALLSLCLSIAHAMEPARSADDLIESIGVCGHWNFAHTPYVKAFEQSKQRLRELGVRYLRDDQLSLRNVEIFNELGIRTQVIIWPDMAKHLDEIRQNPAAVTGIEGPNETNGRPVNYQGIAKFPDSTIAYQRDLYDIVKADPILKNLPVIAPSVAWFDATAKLAPMTQFDYGNIHSYSGGRVPTNIDRYLSDAYTLVGKGNILKPIIATETGYHTAFGIRSEGHQGVTPTARTKYIPRLLADYFNMGITRTYLYEFACSFEQANEAGLKSEAQYGLVNFDMTPTPAFTTLKNFIAILAEPGKTFQPQALDMTLDSAVKTVHHTLVQKSDGTYFLLLWNDVPVYHVEQHDPKYGTDIDNPTVKASIQLPAMPLGDIQVYRPTQSDAPISTLKAQYAFDMQVPDEMLILSFKLPAQSKQSVQPPHTLLSKCDAGTVNLQWQVGQGQNNMAGYFVYRLGKCLGFTDKTQWSDTVPLPGVGYPYAIRAVDQQGNVSDAVQTTVMTPAVFPDLIVTDVTWAPAQPMPGDKVRFTATIKNIGQADSPAKPLGVSFFVDGKHICWSLGHKDAIKPGEVVTLSPDGGPNGNTIWLATAGTHQIMIHADDINRFPEADDSNNKFTKPITIAGATDGMADLIITSFTLKPVNPKAGDEVLFLATTKNIGTGPTDNPTVGISFFVDGKQVAYGIAKGILQPGQEAVIRSVYGPANKATWTCDGNAHTITAATDDVNRIKESDENNNKQTMNLQAAQ